MAMTLTRTWLLLVLLTLGALFAGGAAAGSTPLGLTNVALVLLASGIKAVQILRHFLDLRQAPAGWQAVFYGYLVLMGGVVLGAYTLSKAG